MSQGLAVVSGSTIIHKLLKDGTASFSGSIDISGTLAPDDDNARILGSSEKRWKDIHAVSTTVGAVFEYGLETEGIGQLETGTVVCWHDGKLQPSTFRGDVLVMGVIKNGKDQPIILGAEDILVTGEVEEGDFLITSDKMGHAERLPKNSDYAAKSENIGKIIGQALESCNQDSKLIKCMINKR